ncbi:hypothetical protein FKR81_23300 [Lentzea tibetensis]|uniref:Uncharacterized protein n=1 Tax=Lentzea tibetensis TaxID=2591470 RepID=A0A563EQ25_9PSEU|nr:hypothetical protein [Lentzea tibetensis]TWP49480.1 hypothetical protein FKR81_23300 [Lentzea tibetensis]
MTMAVCTTAATQTRNRVERWILKSVALLRVAQYAAPLPVVAAHNVISWNEHGRLVAGAYLVGAAGRRGCSSTL